MYIYREREKQALRILFPLFVLLFCGVYCCLSFCPYISLDISLDILALILSSNKYYYKTRFQANFVQYSLCKVHKVLKCCTMILFTYTPGTSIPHIKAIYLIHHLYSQAVSSQLFLLLLTVKMQ